MDIEALYIRFISFFRSAFLFENNTLSPVYTTISCDISYIIYDIVHIHVIHSLWEVIGDV